MGSKYISELGAAGGRGALLQESLEVMVGTPEHVFLGSLLLFCLLVFR